MAESRDAISAAVLPRSVIFRGVKVCKGIEPFVVDESNGGFSMPGFGLIRNFWFDSGTDSS